MGKLVLPTMAHKPSRGYLQSTIIKMEDANLILHCDRLQQ